MRDESGCRTIGCSLNQQQKDEAAGNEAIIEKQSHERKCAAGDKNYCSGISNAKEDLVEIFTNTTIALDNVSVGISLFEAGIADIAIGGSIIIGGITIPEALLVDFAIASPLNPLASLENLLGNASSGLTIASDILSGNTYVSSNNHLFIGKDSIVSTRNAILGNYPEANFDFVVSASQLQYDMDRLNGVRLGGSIDVSDTSSLLGQILWYDSPFQDLFDTFR
jgi:hypothetical protein